MNKTKLQNNKIRLMNKIGIMNKIKIMNNQILKLKKKYKLLIETHILSRKDLVK